MKNSKPLPLKVGVIVKTDVSGTGDWVIGTVIVCVPKSCNIEIQPADGTSVVVCKKQNVVRASQYEYDLVAREVIEAKTVRRAELDASKAEQRAADPDAYEASISKFKQPVTLKGNPIKPRVAEVGVDGEEGTPEAAKNAPNFKPHLDRYVTVKDVRTASGRVSVDSGDAVAAFLRGKCIEDCYHDVVRLLLLNEVAVTSRRKTPINVEALKTRYQHLNIGMQRMNLGNLLRNHNIDPSEA